MSAPLLTSEISLSQQLADEAKNGTLNITRRPKTMTIQVPAGGDDRSPNLRKTIQPIKDWIDQASGTSGSVLDKHLTLRDLMNEGALSIAIGGVQYSGTAPSAIDMGTGYQNPLPILLVPPTPTSLTAQGAFKTVILDWVLIAYANHAYVEVYRSATNAIGTAVLIGTSTANLYTDANVSVGSTYYYWVRAIAIGGAAGPYNAVGGTVASLLTIGNTDLGPLVVTAEKLSQGAYPNINLVANPGAEDTLAGVPVAWMDVESSGTFSFLADTTVVAGGSKSFNLHRPVGANACAYGCTAFPVIPGETYSVKVRARGNAASAVGLYFRMFEKTTKPAALSITQGTMTSFSDLLSNGPIPAAWTAYEYTYTVPAGIYWCSFAVYNYLTSTVTDVYFDDVQVGRQITASFLAANSIAVGTAAIQNAAITNAMIANLAVDSAKIANATIGTAKISTLDASVITAGTITTDRLVVNAATVAAAAGALSGTTLFSAVSSIVVGPSTVVSLTSTGAPVTVWGTVEVSGIASTTALAIIGIVVFLKIDATNVKSFQFTVPAWTFSTTRGWDVTIPILWRDTGLASGSHAYKLEVDLSFYDSAGAALSTTGNYSLIEYLVATENKV